MLSRLKKAKSSDEGFTLVELIVVLVILAILAALLIPALTGYIDKAREKQIIAETRQVVQAAQTIFDEEYAKAYITELEPAKYSDILKLAEVNGSIVDDVDPDDGRRKIKFVNGKLSELTYENDGRKCKYVAEPNTADEHLDNDEMYNIIP